MHDLWKKYPKKFKKSLDNQANKFKRKFRKQSGSNSTNSDAGNNSLLKTSDSMLSAEANEPWESMLRESPQGTDENDEGKNIRDLYFPGEPEELKDLPPLF